MLLFTLTTDFGSANHHVAVLKAKIIAQFSQCHIIDLSHDSLPFSMEESTFKFAEAFRHFPPDTCHFMFNDLYASKDSRLLYMNEHRQHIFFPNNGFATLFMHHAPFIVYEIVERPPIFDFPHVVDAYIHCFTGILQGSSDVIKPTDIQHLLIQNPVLNPSDNQSIVTRVIHVDHFGNIILSIKKEEFEEIRAGRNFKIHLPGRLILDRIYRYYHDVPPGQVLCLFNSNGYLEIAIHRENASRMFGFRTSAHSPHREQTIKIFFE